MIATFDLPEPLFEKARLIALQRKITLEILVAEALRREIAMSSALSRRMTRPPISIPQASSMPALTNAEIAALMDEEDLSRFSSP